MPCTCGPCCEFALPVFYRVVTEIARGCPSTGWALSLTAAHVLQVATLFEERAQDEIFGADGDFRAASTVAHIGIARPPLVRRVGCDRLGLPSGHIPLIP
ncbi:hypothetical protein [Streptomyces chartreusis]|uniref:hypothetical protein n=1 Tax=Streptomyces chartreusis TaxID=1969 RepID=UPI0034347343